MGNSLSLDRIEWSACLLLAGKVEETLFLLKTLASVVWGSSTPLAAGSSAASGQNASSALHPKVVSAIQQLFFPDRHGDLPGQGAVAGLVYVTEAIGESEHLVFQNRIGVQMMIWPHFSSVFASAEYAKAAPFVSAEL